MKHPLIRYHGGKFRLADWVISHFPAHKIYVEPFGGGASVLLKKSASAIEVYNDLDGEVVNLFKVLRSDKAAQLAELIYLTPFARTELQEAYEQTDDDVERARRLIVRAQMAYGSAGATRAPHGFGYGETTKGYNKALLWNKHPAILMAVVERLKTVIVENRDAIQCLQEHDSKDTLFFVDPPYMADTRQRDNMYVHEYSDDHHLALLSCVTKLKGKVLLSGYDHQLYNSLLVGWKKVQKKSRAAGDKGAVMRTECLWINPAAQVQDLLAGCL